MMAEMMRVCNLLSKKAKSIPLYAHRFDPFEGIEDLRGDECRVDDFRVDDF